MNRGKIIFIDDDKEILLSYRMMFSPKKVGSATAAINNLFNLDEEEKLMEGEDSNSSVYDIYTASQGLEGVKLVEKALAEKKPFKLAFVDMRMPPGIDGKETAKLLRSLDPDLEIVIVTAYSDHNLENLAKEIGAPDRMLYLKKPFDPIEIKQLALSLTTKWNEARVKDEFLANISHELKTPLASIIGFSSLLEESSNLNEEEMKFVSIIKNSGEMMRYYVDDLISLVHFGKSEYSLELTQVEVRSTIMEVCRLFEPQLAEIDSVELKFIGGNDNIWVEVDRQRFKQCVINLISNSIKYTNKGCVAVRVTEQSESVRVAIEDTGIGISKGDLEAIFERFERVEKDHHAVPGLGLGLAICKKIIDMHSNLSLDVSSQLGEGSTFAIEIKKV